MHIGETVALELNLEFEHACLVLSNDCTLENQPLEELMLYYLGSHRASGSFGSKSGGQLLLIGGPSFLETALMWWNFVARTPDEIAQARADWK